MNIRRFMNALTKCLPEKVIYHANFLFLGIDKQKNKIRTQQD